VTTLLGACLPTPNPHASPCRGSASNYSCNQYVCQLSPDDKMSRCSAVPLKVGSPCEPTTNQTNMTCYHYACSIDKVTKLGSCQLAPNEIGSPCAPSTNSSHTTNSSKLLTLPVCNHFECQPNANASHVMCLAVANKVGSPCATDRTNCSIQQCAIYPSNNTGYCQTVNNICSSKQGKAGVIAGITVGALAAVVALVLAGFLVWRVVAGSASSQPLLSDFDGTTTQSNQNPFYAQNDANANPLYQG